MSLPMHFKGVVEQAPLIFPKMIEKYRTDFYYLFFSEDKVLFFLHRHGNRFGEVFAASGKLFLELDQFKDQFKVWIAPSLVDLDTKFELELTEPQDWDVAFQLAKKRREEVSNLSRYNFSLSGTPH